MALTPETLIRHELAGLPVRVAAADNPDLVGIVGRVAIETTRTLRIESAAADSDGSGVRLRQVPKRGTTFEFALPESEREREVDDAVSTDEAAGDSDFDSDSGSDSDRDRDSDAGRAVTETGTETRTETPPGSASELGPETAGVRSGQSGASVRTPDGEPRAASRRFGECEGAVYVTVDGERLLSRPALRTERASAGDSTWR